MYRMLFTNRWIALAFVAVMALSAIVFATTGAKNVEELTQTENEREPRVGVEPLAERPAAKPAAAKAAAEPTGDGGVMDLAQGTDPTPSGDDGADGGGWGSTARSSSQTGGGDAWASTGNSAPPTRGAYTTSNSITGGTPPSDIVFPPRQGTFTSGPAQ